MVPSRTSPRSMAPPSRLGTVARVVEGGLGSPVGTVAVDDGATLGVRRDRHSCGSQSGEERSGCAARYP